MGLMHARRIAVEAGLLAEVLTTLEIDRPLSAYTPTSPLRLRPWQEPTAAEYKRLFRSVGEPWLWFSRLVPEPAALTAILSDPLVRVWRIFDADQVVGFLELDNGEAGVCELQFVGFVPTYTGRGHGRWLMSEALRLAWGSRVERVRVKTCTLDHPAALPTYLRAGFRAIKREVEVFPDPRLIGLLPASAAPHVPLLRP